MAQTYDSKRLRHERAVDRKLTEAHRAMARRIGALVMRSAATSGGGLATVPNTASARAALKSSVWSTVLKPFYIGTGDDPYNGNEPKSAYARLLYEGITGATRIQVDRQVNQLRATVNDGVVLGWLTGHRPANPIREINTYDPFHKFIDPNGYTLSDRVWRAGIDVRARVDRLLDYEIAHGTSATRIADMLESFLTPGAAGLRTNTPYGREGSYAARRLARTEITAAAGRATINASQANPYVTGVRWALSRAHRCCDVCDEYAAGGANGDGIYPPDQVPAYPAHPHDLCNLQPVTTPAPAATTAQLRTEIRERRAVARALQGAFNPDWMTNALLSGIISDVIERLQKEEDREDAREIARIRQLA